MLSLFLLPPALFAKCPIPANGTLEVDVPAGNLIIDTSGTDSIDWDVNNKQIAVREICRKDDRDGKDTVRIEASGSSGSVKTIPDWHIKVPRTVILDLVTRAGSITIGNSDSKINARTGGGDVSVGNINGETAIMTQGGNVRTGNIGSNAEIRSSYAGNLYLGNVAGDVSVWTLAGDITIASAKKISNAFTGGGNMLIQKVFGTFSGHNDAGSIRIEQAGSSVEASTGSGSIYLKMVPDKQTGDLHVNLKAGAGDITLFLPSGMKADVQATAQGNHVHSDIPLTPQMARGLSGVLSSNGRPGPTIAMPYSSFESTQTGQRNGGGNPIRLHATVGKIDIKLFN
jgi:hypothetical protein